MKKVTPHGQVIKQLRERRERLSTQKEFCHAVRVSERKLRMIENENSPVEIALLERIAKELGVHRQQISVGIDGPVLVANSGNIFETVLADLRSEKFVPRFDEDIASAGTDEQHLFKSASSSNDVTAELMVSLNDETSAYAKELTEILTGLSWAKRNFLDVIPAHDEVAMRRRIRQLLVLLKGNDVWVYDTTVMRRLPESFTIPSADAPHTSEMRLVVAFGPPGEYGETSMRVPIDHGQPFILPAWDMPEAESAELC
jgi:transcriptional regulator with XRE-family HTH domain